MTPDAVAAEISRYTTTQRIIQRSDGWGCMQVTVLLDGVKIGEYDRNYSALYRSFQPFYQNGAFYALYSPHHTATRILRLPDCTDIGGEEPSDKGFCPTEYYVPYHPEKKLVADWGLVAGAVWADDATWKIQYLDLSQVSDGILRREERFERLVLPEKLRLRDAVDLTDYDYEDEKRVVFTTQLAFSLTDNTFDRYY